MAQPMRRFYKQATTGVLPETADSQGVLLDGRPVRTPDKALLAAPTAALAEAIAAEWQQQEEVDSPGGHAPMTGLACTAIDRVAADTGAIAADVAAYAEHDLICYRVDDPPELATRQQALWQPLLDWAAVTYDAPLAVTKGLSVPPHPSDSFGRVASGGRTA